MIFNVRKEADKIFVSFPYNAEVVDYIRTLPDKKWNAETKEWILNEQEVELLKNRFTTQKDLENEQLCKYTDEDKEVSKSFINAIQSKIETDAINNKSISSSTYKPSSLQCIRKMVYIRAQLEEDSSEVKYNWIQSAGVGTARHENIQAILENMTQEGSDWQYIDVADYVTNQQKLGNCLDIRIGSKKGAETHLYNDKLHLSFFCDGIIYRKSTNQYYLFEFKNKTSKKTVGCNDRFPLDHYDQVVVYCMCLNLTKVLLLVENRDTCELLIPPLFTVTQEMKDKMLNKLLSAEQHFIDKTVPEKPEDIDCFFCGYKKYCDRWDMIGENPFKEKEVKDE